jgi:RNA polymerase sigma-70 factor (ECF subfamily)
MPAPDAQELTTLLDRFERPLVRYAQSITGDLESARDVVQETFIKLAGGGMNESSAGEDHARHLEAWLFTVTRNRALDHQRKFSRIVPLELPEERACASPGPAATLERRESAATIFGLLDALSPNQREVIRLKFQNDLSYREIAEVTRLSVTNVGFLLHTGLKKLRQMLRDQTPDDLDLSRFAL